jgi:hypothetical protein
MVIYLVFFHGALLKILHILYWMIGRPSRTMNALGTFFVHSIFIDVTLITGYILTPFFEYSIVWPRVIVLLIFNAILDMCFLFMFLIAIGIHDSDFQVLNVSEERLLSAMIAAFCLLLPSFILRIYVFSYAALRILARMTPVLEFLKFTLPIDRYSFRSICEFAGIIVTIAYVLIALALFTWHGLPDPQRL